MKVSVHAVSTGIVSLIILAVTNWQNALLFFIGGVLFDVDHYLNYVVKKRDLSLRRAHTWYSNLTKDIQTEPKRYLALHIFHTIEFMFLLLALGYIFDNYFLFLGVLFHNFLDLIYMYYYKTWGVRKMSLVQYYFFLKSTDKEGKIIL